jgi:hypothetical protein
LRTDRKHGLDVYELVKSSTFGRNFFKQNKAAPEGRQLKIGQRDTLRGKSIKKMHLGGVALVRRFKKNEPAKGWKTEAVTIALASFDVGKSAVWYKRSDLGSEFG